MAQTLFTPGPTPVPDIVVERMSQPMIHHRSDEAKRVFKNVFASLQTLFCTQEPVLLFTSSATGAMEAAMAALNPTESKAIVFSNGKFSARWAMMLRLRGCLVEEVLVPWGEAITEAVLVPVLVRHPDAQSIWIVQSETSTGVYSDIASLAAVIRAHSSAFVCVDGVTSVAVHESRMDEWGIDALITGSQKGLMLPPGLSFLALSRRAWQFVESKPASTSYYFDVLQTRESWYKNTTPCTPAISLVCGAEVALSMILAEGLENVWIRHTHNTTYLAQRLRNAGYKLFAASPSHAVTAVELPSHLPTLVDTLRIRYGIQIVGGQEQLNGIICRIGHCGNYGIDDMRAVADAFEECMLK